MDKPTDGVGRYEAQEPQDDQDDGYGFEHGFLQRESYQDSVRSIVRCYSSHSNSDPKADAGEFGRVAPAGRGSRAICRDAETRLVSFAPMPVSQSAGSSRLARSFRIRSHPSDQVSWPRHRGAFLGWEPSKLTISAPNLGGCPPLILVIDSSRLLSHAGLVELETVFETLNATEAQLIRSRLEAAGLEAEVDPSIDPPVDRGFHPPGRRHSNQSSHRPGR
jgi:hypothetical protein